jgi:Sec-independent protein secretion pathway component TatC
MSKKREIFILVCVLVALAVVSTYKDPVRDISMGWETFLLFVLAMAIIAITGIDKAVVYLVHLFNEAHEKDRSKKEKEASAIPFHGVGWRKKRV